MNEHHYYLTIIIQDMFNFNNMFLCQFFVKYCFLFFTGYNTTCFKVTEFNLLLSYPKLLSFIMQIGEEYSAQ